MVLAISGCERQYKESKFLMDTIVDVTIVGKRHNVEIAFDEIRRIEDLLSPYKRDSEISQINRNSGISGVRVSRETLDVVEQSVRFARMSDSAFDITIGPIMSLWGFRDGKYRIPSDKEISEKLRLVGYNNILIDHARSSIRLALRDMEIDTGAIAVGYAVDSAIQKLKEARIRNALINAGGEIYAMGSPPGRKAWRIGIKHPRRGNDLLGIIELKDKAVSTSGDYEKFFEIKGRRYCHIIDPRTGKPVQKIMSVTIVADSTTEADALSTALFPMGVEKGIRLIESINGAGCVIVAGSSENDMKLIISDRLKDKIEFKN